ncbi:MAG: Calcium/calmodulin-dependent protein kinase type II subunit gamma, variant 2 [Marteilia pararefringens]
MSDRDASQSMNQQRDAENVEDSSGETSDNQEDNSVEKRRQAAGSILEETAGHNSGSAISTESFNKQMNGFSQSTQFNANYDVVEKINSGSFAVVYKCFKKNTNEVYASKFIRKHQIKSADKELIINEIMINNKLSHRNIVQLYETYDSPQISYLVFEYVDGGELFDEIVSKETYSEMDAYKYIIQLFEALKHCHARNIIHRDIKPENILLKRLRGTHTMLKLADFGVSKDITEKGPQILPVAGSLGYMAPEVVRKKKNSCKTDVYSAGIILYILLCGYPPFPQVNDKKVMINATKYPNITYDKNWDTYSPECIDLVKKMTVVNYKNRFDITQTLSHKWCQKPESITDIFKDRRTSLSNLKQFNIWRKFVAMLGALNVADNLLKRIESHSNIDDGKSPTEETRTEGAKRCDSLDLIDIPANRETSGPQDTTDDRQTPENAGEVINDPHIGLRDAVRKFELNRLNDPKAFAEKINWVESMVYLGRKRIRSLAKYLEAIKEYNKTNKKTSIAEGEDQIQSYDIIELKDSLFSVMITVSSEHNILYIIDGDCELRTFIMY